MPSAITLLPALRIVPRTVYLHVSNPYTIMVENSGDSDLLVSNMSVGGDFSILNDNVTGTTIIPGDSRTFDVRATPSTVGFLSSTIVITSNTPTSPDSFSVFGIGGAISASPSSLSFDQPTNAATPDQLVTITNEWTSSTTVSFRARGRGYAIIAQFPFLGSLAATILAPSASTTLTVSLIRGNSGLLISSIVPIPSEAIIALGDTATGDPFTPAADLLISATTREAPPVFLRSSGPNVDVGGVTAKVPIDTVQFKSEVGAIVSFGGITVQCPGKYMVGGEGTAFEISIRVNGTEILAQRLPSVADQPLILPAELTGECPKSRSCCTVLQLVTGDVVELWGIGLVQTPILWIASL